MILKLNEKSSKNATRKQEHSKVKPDLQIADFQRNPPPPTETKPSAPEVQEDKSIQDLKNKLRKKTTQIFGNQPETTQTQQQAPQTTVTVPISLVSAHLFQIPEKTTPSVNAHALKREALQKYEYILF